MSERGRLYLPIFPLPELTLFPHTLLPLHVFEARYRAMVDDCLGRDRRLAVAALRPGYEADYHGRPRLHEVAGAGEIVRWERLATGRFNIVVRGERRVRIDREVPADTLYRVVEAAALEDRDADGSEAMALAAEVRRRTLHLLRAAGRPTGRAERALEEALSPGALSDQIAAAVVRSFPVRQRLLEETDVVRRLGMLAAILERLARRVEGGP